MSRIRIDLETYSELDLRAAGAYVYARHPSTEILMLGYQIDHKPVQLWDCTETDKVPADLFEMFRTAQEHEWYAFNAAFERIVLQEVWGFFIPIPCWHCTMVKAWSLSFSGGLDAVGKQVGIPQDKQKLRTGKKLIHKFCKPAPKNHKIRRYDRHTSPEDWAEFCTYCKGDVIAEGAIDSLLVQYQTDPMERRYYIQDQTINDRGIPFNRETIQGARKILRAEKMRIKAELKELTGLENPTAWQQMRPLVESWIGELDGFDKDAVDLLIEEHKGSPLAHILTLYRRHNKTSTAKWNAIEPALADDDRGRGMLTFGGAQRTQRWAGRILQPHNLKRGRKDADTMACDLQLGSADYIQFAHGNVMEFLSDTMRAMIDPGPDKELGVADLGSIESRLAGWVTDCEAINKIFREGRDTYRAFGSKVYGVPEGDITSEQRTFCKPPVLGGVYGLGGPGLVSYADSMGVHLGENQAQEFIDVFRAEYPEVPKSWKWLNDTCMKVTDEPAPPAGGKAWAYAGYKVEIYRDDNFLFIKLPSGRRIAYYQPKVEWHMPPWGGPKRRTFTYMGMDQYTHTWRRISTHGGKILENIIQAIARDILAVGIDRALSVGLDVIMHVHDEILIEILKGNKEALALLIKCMTWPMSWALDLLLSADGFTCPRYKKG